MDAFNLLELADNEILIKRGTKPECLDDILAQGSSEVIDKYSSLFSKSIEDKWNGIHKELYQLINRNGFNIIEPKEYVKIASNDLISLEQIREELKGDLRKAAFIISIAREEHRSPSRELLDLYKISDDKSTKMSCLFFAATEHLKKGEYDICLALLTIYLEFANDVVTLPRHIDFITHIYNTLVGCMNRIGIENKRQYFDVISNFHKQQPFFELHKVYANMLNNFKSHVMASHLILDDIRSLIRSGKLEEAKNKAYKNHFNKRISDVFRDEAIRIEGDDGKRAMVLYKIALEIRPNAQLVKSRIEILQTNYGDGR